MKIKCRAYLISKTVNLTTRLIKNDVRLLVYKMHKYHTDHLKDFYDTGLAYIKFPINLITFPFLNEAFLYIVTHLVYWSQMVIRP